MIFDITDRKRAEQELSHRANHDPLTGLPNRDQFRAALDEAIAWAQPQGRAVAVMYVDLDDFKLVNDGFGHEVGDELLAAVADGSRGPPARRTSSGATAATSSSCCCRTFRRRPRSATRAAEDGGEARARRARASRCRPARSSSDVSASVGVSLFPFDAADTQTLLKHADAAMYDAKAAGRDACRFYEPGARDSEERLALTAPAEAGDQAGRACAPLPADSRARLRADDRRGGAGALDRQRARPDRAGRVHPARGAHRPDPPAERVGDPRGQQAGRGVAAAGTTAMSRSTSRPTPASRSAPGRSR